MEVSFNDFSTLMILGFISLIVAMPVKFSASAVGAPTRTQPPPRGSSLTF